MAFLRDVISQPTVRGVAERLLSLAADMVTDPRNPPGCLTVRGALSSGEEADPIRRELPLAAASFAHCQNFSAAGLSRPFGKAMPKATGFGSGVSRSRVRWKQLKPSVLIAGFPIPSR